MNKVSNVNGYFEMTSLAEKTEMRTFLLTTQYQMWWMALPCVSLEVTIKQQELSFCKSPSLNLQEKQIIPLKVNN